jgi:hypothetical protein
VVGRDSEMTDAGAIPVRLSCSFGLPAGFSRGSGRVLVVALLNWEARW